MFRGGIGQHEVAHSRLNTIAVELWNSGLFGRLFSLWRHRLTYRHRVLPLAQFEMLPQRFCKSIGLLAIGEDVEPSNGSGEGHIDEVDPIEGFLVLNRAELLFGEELLGSFRFGDGDALQLFVQVERHPIFRISILIINAKGHDHVLKFEPLALVYGHDLYGGQILPCADVPLLAFDVPPSRQIRQGTPHTLELEQQIERGVDHGIGAAQEPEGLENLGPKLIQALLGKLDFLGPGEHLL